MRHYRQLKFRPDRRPRQILRGNPLKPKILTKRLEELQELGLSPQHHQMLVTDLSGTNVDPSNAIYVLEWWKARLSLQRFIELPQEANPKASASLIDNLQRYAFKYKLSAYDLALDGELQIDYWTELQHFIQMSGVNPYFRAEWPTLHKVIAELRLHYHHREPERVLWLGQLVKENIKLSARRIGYEEGSPAIKLLRGAYLGDPVGSEEHTELPQAAIVSIEETFKPSDVISFLKDAELNLEPSTYFIPKYHQPFLSFPDGKVWTVISSEDKENEKKSLGDCAVGEYTDSSIIVISLREPVMVSPQGTYYRTRLRGEIVFPSNVSAKPSYQEFRQSMGVINQLRGSANSKPSASMHKYIVPLLEQEWVAHLIRPNHRPDDIFWPSDLSPENRAYLEAKNPKLFDARAFYEQVKALDFPKRLEDKIMEGIEFPTSYVIQILAEIGSGEFDYHGGSPRSGIVTRTLKRRLQEKLPDPELQQLLNAAEESLLRLRSKEIAEKYHYVGFELSVPRIQEILQQQATGEAHSLLELACQSLAEKIKRKEEGLKELEELVSQLLLTGGKEHPGVWPPRERSGPENDLKILLDTGAALREDQLVDILTEYRDWLRDEERSGQKRFVFHLALDSLTKRVARNLEISSVLPILEDLVLNPETPYESVQAILNTDVVELAEAQICSLLSEKDLLPGRTLAALLSLQDKLRVKSLTQPQRTLKIAQQAMFRLKDRRIIDQVIPWIELPVRGIIKVLSEPRMHPIIRNTAIEAVRRKITNNDSRVREQVFEAVKGLLLRTKDKSFIRQLLELYQGHQHQYRLFHNFMVARLDWLTLDRNRTFFLKLIGSSLPKNDTSYHFTQSLPKFLYRLLRKMVVDNLVEDNCSFLLKILFDVKFDDESLKAVRALLESILDVILQDPKKLTAELCDWYQNMPKGWGTHEHKTFKNKLPLSPKLLRQFVGLLKITQNTGNNCYLDLAVTVAEMMSSEDKTKLQKLAMPLVKAAFASNRGIRYKEYLERLLPRRRRK